MKEILRRLGIEELNYMQQDSLTATIDYCGAFDDVNLRNEFMRLL